MSDAAARWATILDALADGAARATGALADGGDLEVAAWEPPTDLGPLPEALAPRAREVLALLEQVQADGARHARALQDQAGELGVRRDAMAAYARAGRHPAGAA